MQKLSEQVETAEYSFSTYGNSWSRDEISSRERERVDTCDETANL